MGTLLNANLVCSFKKVGTFTRVVDGKKKVVAKLGGNCASYVCTPDGRVIHAVANNVDANTLLREVRWGLELWKQIRSLTPKEQVRVVRAAHQKRQSSGHPFGLNDSNDAVVFLGTFVQPNSGNPVLVNGDAALINAAIKTLEAGPTNAETLANSRSQAVQPSSGSSGNAAPVNGDAAVIDAAIKAIEPVPANAESTGDLRIEATGNTAEVPVQTATMTLELNGNVDAAVIYANASFQVQTAAVTNLNVNGINGLVVFLTVHTHLAKHGLESIDEVYPWVWQNLCGEQVSASPVQTVELKPQPKRIRCQLNVSTYTCLEAVPFDRVEKLK